MKLSCKKISNKKALIAGGFLLLLLVFTYVVYAGSRRETVLEFGMFTGSYWDVANANSFLIIDEASSLRKNIRAYGSIITAVL